MMLSSRDGHPSLLELTFRGRLIIRSAPTCRNDKPISKIIEIYHSGLGLVRQVAVFSLFVGVVLLAIGAFAFYVFLQSNLVDLGTLRVENQILVYICFLGVGLPLLVIGAGSLVDSWSDLLIRLVGFPASALSGALLCAIAIVSLPIFTTGYVTSVDYAVVASPVPALACPRPTFGCESRCYDGFVFNASSTVATERSSFDYCFFFPSGLRTGVPGKYHGIVWAACAVTLLSILTCSSSGLGGRISTCPGSLTVRYSSIDLECKNFRIISRSCLSMTPSTSTVDP